MGETMLPQKETKQSRRGGVRYLDAVACAKVDSCASLRADTIGAAGLFSALSLSDPEHLAAGVSA